MVPTESRHQEAAAKARQALGLPRSAPLQPAQISVLLKCLALEMLKDRGHSDDADLTNPACALRVRTDIEGTLSEYLNDYGSALPLAYAFWHSYPVYRRRVVDLVLESRLSHPMAAELCLEPDPVEDFETKLPGRFHHAVIFAEPTLFLHEFFPLCIDALAGDGEGHGGPFVNIVAGHIDWIEYGRLRRVLYLDVGTGCFRECTLDAPLAVDSVQFLCLGRHERALHRNWSRRLSLPQVNPWEPAALADDKVMTVRGWRALGLEVPLQAGADEARLLERERVMKPVFCSEGDGVRYVPANSPLPPRSATGQPMLVEERRDGVCYRDAGTGAPRTLALRLNIAFDGEGYVAESGYAVLGPDLETPASKGRGGEIGDINRVLTGLARRDDGRPLAVDGSVWQSVLSHAERAATLFPGLLLVGIDLVLDVDGADRVKAVFLEANPRPAGLCRSRFLAGAGESGVSLKLWRGMETLLLRAQTVDARS